MPLTPAGRQLPCHAYEQGHRNGFAADATTHAMDVCSRTNGPKSTGTLMTAIVVMTATVTPIAVYSGKDFVTATRTRSMSDAMRTTGTGGGSYATTRPWMP